MAAAVAQALVAIHKKLELEGRGPGGRAQAKALPLGFAAKGSARSLDEALPDGGLPRGAVVEIASPSTLGRATTIALRACAAFQVEAKLRSGGPAREAGAARGAGATAGSWCAFIDPWSTLHAPSVEASGVDPSRLLVVRAPVDALSRVVVRVAESRIFGVVVVDTSGVPGTKGGIRLDRWGTVVRRLSLVVERTDTTVLLLTDRSAHRAMPLPVALRLELANLEVSVVDGSSIQMRVAKDRHGRVAPPVVVLVSANGVAV